MLAFWKITESRCLCLCLLGSADAQGKADENTWTDWSPAVVRNLKGSCLVLGWFSLLEGGPCGRKYKPHRGLGVCVDVAW